MYLQAVAMYDGSNVKLQLNSFFYEFPPAMTWTKIQQTANKPAMHYNFNVIVLLLRLEVKLIKQT